ncbi:MAG: DUF2400 family protein [Thermoplasmata archaeon]
MAEHRPSREFPAHLETLYRNFPVERSLGQDPLSGVRALPRDRRHAEVAGVVASTLAIGTTTSIRRAFADLLARSGGDLTTALDDGRIAERFAGFRHRWIRGDQMAHLARRLRAIYDGSGSLEAVFAEGFRGPEGFAGGVDSLARALRGPVGRRRSPPGYDRLFPSPLDAGRSPCKRLTLFVRWMARPTYPDLGVWTSVPPSELRIPLDQHVYWIAYHLGLTGRRSRSWAAVEEITAALRRIDPVDPIKYDFVLCHTGISGDCPKERDLVVCGPCVVRPDCRLWRGVRTAA